jgi:hypothetical protein
LREEESIIEDLITALRQQASAYDPKKFHLDNILSQLGPAIKLNMLRVSEHLLMMLIGFSYRPFYNLTFPVFIID